METEVLDCSGLACPMPVLKTRKAIDQLKVGDILLMISTDPGSKPDMEAWTKKTGHLLMDVKKEEEKFKFWIKKEHG
jgi:tRNA 2-thiouridine synthesizing protein A|uniref:Sulfurtransferase TusA family protein n=1 Tax=Leptospirillum ferriphilum TaxID=178606 RepID=A0A7C3LUL7_9BACT